MSVDALINSCEVSCWRHKGSVEAIIRTLGPMAERPPAILVTCS